MIEMDDKEFKKKLQDAVKKKTVIIGENRVMALLRKGEGKLVVFSKDCRVKDDVTLLAKDKVEVYAFPGTNMELGELCKKPFSVSLLVLN
jgi:large subunit ribosomal protein L30e